METNINNNLNLNKYLDGELTKLNIDDCLIIIPKNNSSIENIQNNLSKVANDFSIINYSFLLG